MAADVVPRGVFLLTDSFYDARELRIIGDLRIRGLFEEKVTPATQKAVAEVCCLQRLEKCVVGYNFSNVLLHRARREVLLSESDLVLRVPVFGIEFL